MTSAFSTPVTPSTSRMVDLGDLSLHITTYKGNGPEMLLIHGIGSGSPTWFPVINGLARHVTPITIDLRGHGLSGKPDAGYGYDDYVADLDRLITGLELEQPIVMGHSLGGLITFRWAMKHPEKARALIIEDSPLESSIRFRPVLNGSILLNLLPYNLVKRYYAWEHPEWTRHIVEIRSRIIKVTKRVVFTELRDATLKRNHLDSDGAMRSIRAPVLYIHGTPRTGSLVQEDHVTDLPNHLPHVEIVHIRNGSHTMHRDQPEAFLNAVERFLRNHDIIGA